METLSKIYKGVNYTEEWKPIKGYEGIYEISSFGRVKSLRSNKIIKPSNSGTYLKIELNLNGISKKIYVHKLVAISFLNHKPNKFEKVIDHINGNQLDNNFFNLQIITHRENISKSFKKYLPIGVRMIKNKFSSSIYIKGKNISLGSFDTKEEAFLYYQKALKSIEKGEEITFKRRLTSSKYKGVHFCKTRDKWLANFNRKYIGIYNSEEEAYQKREEYLKLVTNKQ
jgi:hypothetical protein